MTPPEPPIHAQMDAYTDDRFLRVARTTWYEWLRNSTSPEDRHQREAHLEMNHFNRLKSSAQRTGREHLITLAQEQATHERDWMQGRRPDKPPHLTEAQR